MDGKNSCLGCSKSVCVHLLIYDIIPMCFCCNILVYYSIIHYNMVRKTVSSRLVDKTNDTYTIHSTGFRARALCGVKSLAALSLRKPCRHGNIIIYIARL